MGILGIYVRTSIEKENTSIDQQKKLGISFCKKNDFQYQIYEDIGKSGYEIEDEKNPFKNRKGLTKLIDDIENKFIDKIWVFENSRLSRNEYSSFLLSRIFQKHNVIVYENGKEFDFNNPQNKMIQGILTQISEYERHLITNRTTRGVHDLINRGNRSYNELYGYKKSGKKSDGKYLSWTSVNSEIENIKYCFQKYLSGQSVKSIIQDITKEIPNGTVIHKWIRILRHFEYTGFSLNMDGLEIYNKFKKCEIDNLQELHNKKYYIKSVNYPVKIVSVENWIKTVEKLQGYKKIYKDRMRRTDTEILTGIVSCPYCELRYYVCKDKKYSYYRHSPNKKCEQSPKSFNTNKMNDLIETFFFYFYLVYDDTKTLIEDSQRLIKINQMEIKEKISAVDIENKKLEKQILRFQNIYEDSEDRELLKLTLIKEKELNSKKDKNDNLLIKLRTELEDLKNKYNKDELELTYYNVKEIVINFFEKMSIEEKRTSIIKVIKCCQIFNTYLAIDTGKLLFIFNTKEEYKLQDSIFNNFKKDRNFKDNFLNSSKLRDNNGELSKMILDIKEGKKDKYTLEERRNLLKNMWNYFQARNLGDIVIKEFYLNNKDTIDLKGSMEKKLQKIGIDYPIADIEKIISFTKDI